MITAVDGEVVYSLDGREIFSSGGKTFPRAPMTIQFSTGLIDLPFKGDRAWDMHVNWMYYQSGQALSVEEVQQAVDGLYANGVNHIDTTSAA